MFCTNCGKEIKEGHKFCTNCGKSVENIVPPTEDKFAFEQTVEKKETQETTPLTYKQPTNSNQTRAYNKGTSGTATASLIIGVMSIMLSFLISILVLPLTITGFILGITTKEKSGIRTAGIVLNAISAVISILVIVVLVIILFTISKDISAEHEDYKSNSISGTWTCTTEEDETEEDPEYTTFYFYNDYDYSIYNLKNSDDSYLYGKYTYTSSKEKQNSDLYNYYVIRLYDSDDDTHSSDKRDYTAEYEVSINNTKTSGTISNKDKSIEYKCSVYE